MVVNLLILMTMRKTKTDKQFQAELFKVRPSLQILGKYEGANKRILVQDKYGKCSIKPSHLLAGHTPSIQTAIDKTAYFRAELKEMSPNIKVLGKYVNAKTKIEVIIDGRVRFIKPKDLLS